MKPVRHMMCRAALLAGLFAPQMLAAQELETWDGLVLREGKAHVELGEGPSGLDAVYVRPGVKFAPYKSVKLDPVVVEFSKNWELRARDSGRQFSPAELQGIRDQLAKLMRDVFVQELTTHGYRVVDAASADTLRVTTGLLEVYINPRNGADASTSSMKTYAPGAGSMMLLLEARDGPTGQLLARAIDQGADKNITTPALNTAEPSGAAAREMMAIWARKLREALDRLNAQEK
jgi:hypothetical protein